MRMSSITRLLVGAALLVGCAAFAADPKTKTLSQPLVVNGTLTTTDDASIQGDTLTVGTGAAADQSLCWNVDFDGACLYWDESQSALVWGAAGLGTFIVEGGDPFIGLRDTDFAAGYHGSFSQACADADSDGLPKCAILMSPTAEGGQKNSLMRIEAYSSAEAPGLRWYDDATYLRWYEITMEYGAKAHAWHRGTQGDVVDFNFTADLIIYDSEATDTDSDGYADELGLTIDVSGNLTASRTWNVADASGTPTLASGAATSGVTLWGDVGNAAFDTGTEVCAVAGLACGMSIDLDSGTLGAEIACGSAPTGSASGYFLAFCY